jgi:hypothetical protein
MVAYMVDGDVQGLRKARQVRVMDLNPLEVMLGPNHKAYAESLEQEKPDTFYPRDQGYMSE